jgi:hypothetical protein
VEKQVDARHAPTHRLEAGTITQGPLSESGVFVVQVEARFEFSKRSDLVLTFRAASNDVFDHFLVGYAKIFQASAIIGYLLED